MTRQGWALRLYRGVHRQDGYRVTVAELGAAMYCGCKRLVQVTIGDANCQRCGKLVPF